VTGRGAALAALALLASCRCGDRPAAGGDAARPIDAASAIDAAPPPSWPALASFPVAEPAVTVALPARADVPRFDVHGPVVIGDVAVVAASPVGFAAIALPTGRVIWTRPAGARVAPPLAVGAAIILVGDCPDDVASPAGELLLGCLTQVDAARGTDLGAAIVRGVRGDVEAFAAAPGPSRLRATGDGALLWQRGEHAVTVALATGRATPAPPIVDRAELTYAGATWRWAVEGEVLVARDGADQERWRFGRRVAALLGAFAAEPPQVPVVRAVVASTREGQGVFSIIDIDGTSGSQGSAAHPVPGIQVLTTGFGPHGVTVLAVRLDTSLTRDYIAAFDGNGLLLWVWPLPEQARPDAVGIALDAARVVVFHDGDRLSVLPLTWENPTAPAAPTAP
jgi:hypothetical protein